MASYESEAAELFENIESEGIPEWLEAVRRRGPSTASGKGLAPTPPSKNVVTFTDLRTAMDKVGAQIKTNSDAIGAVSTKLAATAASAKKDHEERKKEGETFKKDVNGKVMTLALLPLLMQPPTYTIPANTAGIGNANPIPLAPPQTSMVNALLPLLLVGGLGGSGGGLGGGGDGGMDNTMVLALALMLSQQPRNP